jgi:serine/threonine protein phosphatase PrpC
MQSNSSSDFDAGPMALDVFGHSEVGGSRKSNDDDYLCLQLPGTPEPRVLVAVADGMGGHLSGHMASRLAIKSLRSEFARHSESPEGEDRTDRQLLAQAFRRANAEIMRLAATSETLRGMGTTLVAALISGQRAVIANVGDSRAYLVRGETCAQITKDHSWRAKQNELGVTDDQLRASPFWGTITRCVGYDGDIEVDVFERPFEPEDQLFLCSDGLWESVGARDIVEAFKKFADAEGICRSLVELANERDGSDNITGAVLRGPRSEHEGEPSKTIPVDLQVLRNQQGSRNR